MSDNWKVYAHINKINKKAYIGVTSNSLSKRWQNGNGYSQCAYFRNAINKYGWEGFEHILIIEGLSKDMAMILEIELIKKFNLTNSKFGYNISNGGTAPMKGRKHKDKTLLLYSKSRGGKGNPFYGKHHSQQTKEKLGRMVVCLNTGIIYKTIKDTKIPQVEACLNGRQLSAGKDKCGNPLFWMEYSENIDIEKEYQKMLKEYPMLIKEKLINKEIKKYGKIVCLNNNKVYNSITDCEYDLNINKQDIIDACLGNRNRKKAKGYVFSLYEDYLKLTDEDIINKIKLSKLRGASKDIIVCLNTKEEFNSSIETIKITNKLKYVDTILECCKGIRTYGGEHIKTTEKLVWRYFSDYEKLSDNEIDYLIKKANPILIKCINDEKLFYSLGSASKYYGVISTSISACCRGIYKSCGNGLKFEYYYNFVLDNDTNIVL